MVHHHCLVDQLIVYTCSLFPVNETIFCETTTRTADVWKPAGLLLNTGIIYHLYYCSGGPTPTACMIMLYFLYLLSTWRDNIVRTTILKVQQYHKSLHTSYLQHSLDKVGGNLYLVKFRNTRLDSNWASQWLYNLLIFSTELGRLLSFTSTF